MSEIVVFEELGIELIVVEVKGKRAFTAEMVGKGLGYASPTQSISKLHLQYEDELNEGVCWDWYDIQNHRIDDAATSTRIYYQIGVNMLGMFARTKPAKAFRQWAAGVLAEHQAASPSQLDQQISELVGKRLTYEPRCTICRSKLRDQIDAMLDDTQYRQVDIIAFAAEHGVKISAPSLSRHNRHRVPNAAPMVLAANPDIGMSILFQHLMSAIQNRSLSALSDRDLVKYAHAVGSALLSHQSAKPALPPSE